LKHLLNNLNDPFFFTSQFTNEKNLKAHRETTAPEILNDIDRVDWFVGGLGTTGSSRAIIETIRERDTHMKAIGVCGATGELIPGIRASEQLVEAGFCERKIYDKMITLMPETAVDCMLELNRKSGLLCGPSSGAQYAAIKEYFTDNPTQKETNIVFIACDRMEWYISYIRKYRPDLFEIKTAEQDNYATFYPDHTIAVASQINPHNMDLWIEQQSPIIIDMRTPASLKVISVDGAINIPENMLEDMIGKTQPFPKGKKVMFICAVGQKSLKVAAYLRHKGVNAYSLEGGIVAYQKIQRKAA
jgi:cysteine synthase B